MHHVPAALLWLVLATAGTPAPPASASTEGIGIGAETSASNVLRRPELGPLHTSLEAIQASLSGLGTACPGVDSAVAATPDEVGRRADGTRRSAACLAAAQVSPNPPTAPSQISFWVYLAGTLVLALIGWLISKL